MFNRRLPPHLTARLRRAALFGLMAGAVTWALAQTPAPHLPTLMPPSPPALLVQQTLPAQARHVIPLEVPARAESYLGFSELRTTARLAAVSLVDPDGRTVWRRTPQALSRQPAAEIRQPELGDAYQLPPVLNPAAGRWQLVLERTATDAHPARLLFTYRVNPRFSLALWTQPDAPAVGQPQLLTLRAYDMGDTPTQRPALAVRVLDARGQAVVDTTADARLPTPSGPQPVIEPGVFFAQWQPAQAGTHRIQVQWQPQPDRTPLVLSRTVEVASAEAQLRFLGMTPEMGANCVQAVALSFEVLLDKPPAPGSSHVVNAQVSGQQGGQQVSMAVNFNGTTGVARGRLTAQALRTLGWPLRQIDSSRLLRFTPDLQVLAAGPRIDLLQQMPPQPPCP
jgi:hypothetical protein